MKFWSISTLSLHNPLGVFDGFRAFSHQDKRGEPYRTRVHHSFPAYPVTRFVKNLGSNEQHKPIVHGVFLYPSFSLNIHQTSILFHPFSLKPLFQQYTKTHQNTIHFLRKPQGPHTKNLRHDPWDFPPRPRYASAVSAGGASAAQGQRGWSSCAPGFLAQEEGWWWWVAGRILA